MGYSEHLTDRVRSHMDGVVEYEERRVMDGLGFFIDDRMVLCVLGDSMCLPEAGDHPTHPSAETAQAYEFAGRPVAGWLAISEATLDDEGLAGWIDLALGEPKRYSPQASTSRV